MAVAVVAYKDGRGSLPPLEDFPPYQGARQQPPFHEQHQPFREQFKSQLYQSYRQRPYSQDLSPSYSEQLPFRDRSLLRDYPSGKSRRFYGDSSPVRDATDLKRQTSFYLDGAPFRDQQYRDQPPFRNEQSLQDQQLNDQYSYLQPSFRDDFRFSNLYDKPISSFKDQAQPDQETVSYGRDLDYLKHGNGKKQANVALRISSACKAMVLLAYREPRSRVCLRAVDLTLRERSSVERADTHDGGAVVNADDHPEVVAPV